MKKFLLFIFCLLLTVAPTLASEKIKYSSPQTGIYIFKINTAKYGDKIKPFMVHHLTTPKKVYDDNCFELVVNGGFFDVKNGKSVSYVVIDKEVVGDIENYKELTRKLEEEGRLDKVLTRAELRILENKNGKLKFDIAYHTDPIPDGYTLKHALGAGPMLEPTMDLAKEGFVVYENGMVKSQSVDILKRRERTAIGLKGKNLYIVLFTTAHKVDAYEMRDYMVKNLKLKKILALDGGLSTSINYKDTSVGSLGKYQRRVKSFLVIEK